MVSIMLFRIQTMNVLIMCVGLISLFSIAALTPVSASGGSLQFTIQGYGTVTGELTNAIIMPNNSVSMMMNVNSQMQTSSGAVQITSSGTWIGLRNGSALSGQIQGVVGRAQVCVLVCAAADFVGQGQWSGQLNGTHGAGGLEGTITFTDSPTPQIPTGQPFPISGTWSADLETPAPEFPSATSIFMLVTSMFASLLLISSQRQRASNKVPRGLMIHGSEGFE
jgi:hypothetical protein